MQLSLAKAHKLVRELTMHINADQYKVRDLRNRQVNTSLVTIDTLPNVITERRNAFIQGLEQLIHLNGILRDIRKNIGYANARAKPTGDDSSSINDVLCEINIINRDITLTDIILGDGESSLKVFDSFKTDEDLQALFLQKQSLSGATSMMSRYEDHSVINMDVITPAIAKQWNDKRNALRSSKRHLEETVARANLTLTISLSDDDALLLEELNLL